MWYLAVPCPSLHTLGLSSTIVAETLHWMMNLCQLRSSTTSWPASLLLQNSEKGYVKYNETKMYKIIYEHEHVKLYLRNSVLQATDISIFPIRNNVHFLLQKPTFSTSGYMNLHWGHSQKGDGPVTVHWTQTLDTLQTQWWRMYQLVTTMIVSTWKWNPKTKHEVEVVRHKEQILYYDVVYKEIPYFTFVLTYLWGKVLTFKCFKLLISMFVSQINTVQTIQHEGS
jgi:hypothetical protein